MRDGVLSIEEGNTLNPFVINGKEVKKSNPLETKCATFYRAKRSDIKATIFQIYLKTYHNMNSESNIPNTAIVVKAGTKWGKSQIPLSFDQRKVLFEQCPESNVKRGTSQMCAPLLCLFFGCDLMVKENVNVFKELQKERYVNFENWF